MKANDYYLSLGSNLGNKLLNLQKAIEFLASVAKLKKTSSIYLSKGQFNNDKLADFYNMAVKVSTPMHPIELLNLIQKFEYSINQVPSKHWQNRQIDIDIVFGPNFSSKRLTIPHKLWATRDFVVFPLKELESAKFNSLSIDIRYLYAKM